MGTYTYEFDETPSFTTCIAEGHTTNWIDEASFFETVIHLAKKNSLRKLYVDCRGATRSQDIKELFMLTEYIYNRGLGDFGMQIALVPSEANFQTTVIFEHYCKRRGLDIRCFQDPNKAEDWLTAIE